MGNYSMQAKDHLLTDSAMDTSYDYIITGGGCAGLSLAYYLNRSSQRGQRILILDAEAKNQNDKTWCFWTDQDLPFACAQHTAWQEMEILTPGHNLTQSIDPFRYVFVNSLSFYQEVKAELEQNPQIEFRYEKVDSVEDLPEGSVVYTSQGSYYARYTFNSIIFPLQREPEQYFYLSQHFGGWFVETQKPVFDPNRIRLMDFRIEQNDEVRFVYILPFSETEALVEYTVFSENTWHTDAYDQALRQYLTEELGVNHYTITHRERGSIPMTNHPFARQKGKHVVNLGTAAGLTKATTGYTFLSIQRHAQQLVQALEKSGEPVVKPRKRARFAFYDELLLYLIRNQGWRIRDIFARLFRQNDFRTILRFLAEDTRLHEELPILIRLPWGPFFRAIWDYKILGKTAPQPHVALQPKTHPIQS